MLRRGVEWARDGIGVLPAAVYALAGWGGGEPGVGCRLAVAARRDVTNRGDGNECRKKEMGVREFERHELIQDTATGFAVACLLF